MNYREYQIQDDKSIGDSGTETIDIDIIDPITALIIDFELTNGAAIVNNEPPEKAISKIELVDGGATYLSMTGQEAVAIAAYELGRWPDHWYDEYLSRTQAIQIPLLFGRYLGDPEYGFDSTRLKNPQIKVTWAKASGHLTASLTLGLWAKIMEGVPSPAKILLTKGVETFVGAASGDHKTDMWNDYPYRRLFLRPYLSGSFLYNLITRYKLTCDADKLKLFDYAAFEFFTLCKMIFPRFEIYKQDRVDSGTKKECWMAGNVWAVGQGGSAGYIVGLNTSGDEMYLPYATDHAGTALTDCPIDAHILGDFPHNVLCYQFGRPEDPASWFNAPGYKDIDLILTQGAVSSSIAVLLQQARPHPTA